MCQVLESWLASCKSQWLQARRRWKDEPASEENWQLYIQGVARKLKWEAWAA